MNRKYVIIEEPIQARTTDVIAEAYEKGFQNGYYKILFETESLEEARRELAKYTITVHRVENFYNVKRYEALLTYIEALDWNEDIEEWEGDLDSLEFAEIINKEDDNKDEE